MKACTLLTEYQRRSRVVNALFHFQFQMLQTLRSSATTQPTFLNSINIVFRENRLNLSNGIQGWNEKMSSSSLSGPLELSYISTIWERLASCIGNCGHYRCCQKHTRSITDSYDILQAFNVFGHWLETHFSQALISWRLKRIIFNWWTINLVVSE